MEIQQSQTKTQARAEKLDALYETWAGHAAQQVDAQAQGLNYMVIVTRWSGRGKVKATTYMFSTDIIAINCEEYWRARGGIITLVRTQVLSEYGYTGDAFDADWA